MVSFLQRMNRFTFRINSLVNLKLFNRLSNLKKTVTSLTFFSIGIKFYAHSRERGMTLVEVILIAVFLVATVTGVAYFFTHTKTTMSSSSQVMDCQFVVKQALENTVSLGTRLYGYKIKHHNPNLRYDPLFITKNAKAYDVDDNIKSTGSGSQLNFPPYMYQSLYKNLVGMDISTPIKISPETNTGKILISDKSLHPIEISTSTLVVNSINALQYLYNSDPDYSTNDGKNVSSSIYKKYEERFKLDNMQFYVKITPVKDNTVLSVRPILTRPRFPQKSNAISSDLTILGETDVGFEVKAQLKYQTNQQNFSCDAKRRFYHQMTGESGNAKALDVTLSGLKNGAGKDFLQDASFINTSCDTHGSGYKDITLTLDFNTVTESPQIGTMILCQMNSYCRSEGDDGDYTHLGITCTPEMGQWQRCHHIQPKTHSDQSWIFKAKLKAQQELTLQFDDMKINRRYDLNIAEFAIDGEKVREQKVIFYIDSGRRPYIGVADRKITDDNVGLPDDHQKGRNYNGPNTDWKIPTDALSDEWLQCNQNDVDFEATLKDQFTHNLKNCDTEGIRKDGNGDSVITADITNNISEGRFCKSTLASIQHGRQTITFKPKDTCGDGTPRDLVWDTDLPSTFESKGFFDDSDEDPNDGVIWLRTQTGYPITTKVPAKTTSGKFPKHYSLDCQDKYIGNVMRDDGNGGSLVCTLTNANASDADGANPGDLSMKFYHVCGTSECTESKWAVYPPVAGSCINVQCGSGYICCNDPQGDCGGVQHQQCQEDKWPHECDEPPCGSNTSDWSGCPPYGLYACSYGGWGCDGARDEHGHTPPSYPPIEDCSCATTQGKVGCCTTIKGKLKCSSGGLGRGPVDKNTGIGSLYCVQGSLNVGRGYKAVYREVNINKGHYTEEYFAKNSHTGKHESFKYKCSTSRSWNCGDSHHPELCPFPFLYPRENSHDCTGTPDCIIEDQDPANCLQWHNSVCVSKPCLVLEDPYPLSCEGLFKGGTCVKPGGGCGSRGRGGGDKTKEKATDRSAC